jgi:hypothetical protein
MEGVTENTHIPRDVEERFGEVRELVQGREVGEAVVHECGSVMVWADDVVRCRLRGIRAMSTVRDHQAKEGERCQHCEQ